MHWIAKLNGWAVPCANNTTLDSGSSGDTMRTEEKTGSIKTPVSLLDVSGTSDTENLVEDGVQGMPTEGVAAENAAVAGNPVLIGGRYDSSARTLGDGDAGAIAVSAAGKALVVEDSAAAIKTAVEIMDDWDESDRAKVNPIAGQAGVAAGAGAVGNTTQRVTLASDDPAVALLTSAVSSNNSTTSTLSGDATFTGTGDDCLGYSAVTVNLYADQDSATDGMTFQFSSDNSNWDDVYQFTLDASASTDRRFQFPVTARYFRVVYTNGSTVQGAFRVQTILHRQNVLTSIHRVDDIVRTDRSAQLVKAVCAAKVAEATTATGAVDGEYEALSMTGWRELRTRDQRQLDLADCNDYTVFTTLGNDTLNLADSVNHLFGTGSITFDKVNGAANTVYAGVQDSFTAIDVSERFESGSFVALGCYLPSVANVVAVFLRVGTDSSNYNEWEWPVSELSAGQWLSLRSPTNQPTGYAGNGWNPASISYVSFGVEFSTETDTLSGIVFDNVHMVGGRVTDSTIDASVTSSVNTPNINLHRVGGTPTDTNSGTVSAGTQRVVLATNVALPAGTNAIGKLAANSGVDIGDVDVTSIAAGTNLIGATAPAASAAASGTSTFYDSDLDETKIEVTDNATVRIYSIQAFNTTAAPLFLQMWDLDADNVTVGTTAPTNQYVIPGNADSDGAGFVITFPVPKAYSTGFTVACTTDSQGSSAPSAGACIVNIEYVSAA